MSDWPADQYIGPIVSTEHIYSWGGHVFHDTINSLASKNWPGVNIGLYISFTLPCPFVVRSLFSLNGTTASGNIDLGVYALDGTLIVSKGSTAQAGTSTLQILTVTETLLSPGAYYMAMSASLVATTVLGHSYGVAGQVCGGILRASSQLPLTTLPTFASNAGGTVPVMGIASITSF